MSQPLPFGKTLGGFADGFDIIPARSTAESEPDYIIPTGEHHIARTYMAYDGTVTACAVRLWFYVGGVWYRGASTDDTDGDALTGSNEARDWEIEPGTRIGFTVESITGGGTVAVVAEGIV